MCLDLNLLKWEFLILGGATLAGGLSVTAYESRLPVTVLKFFTYGKFSLGGKKTFFNHLEVPKRWFQHYYVAGTLYSIWLLYLIANTYLLSRPVGSMALRWLDFIGSSHRSTTVSATTTCLAMALFCLQVWKRLYETHVVSVFSDSKMNFFAYFIGIFHYLGSFSAIIVEAPGFAGPSDEFGSTLSANDIGTYQIVGSVIFLWAWYNQFKSAVILASLRKDPKGQVVCYEHKIPEGGLFSLVSSPHLLCEVTMYFALLIILWGNSTWPYVFFWVLINQIYCAVQTHRWYQRKFEDYPKQRKAIFPFIF